MFGSCLGMLAVILVSDLFFVVDVVAFVFLY